MLNDKEYKQITTELKIALKNNDLPWLVRERNRYFCSALISYWNTLYSQTKEEKYRLGRIFLNKILKHSVNRKKWDKFYLENIYPYYNKETN